MTCSQFDLTATADSTSQISLMWADMERKRAVAGLRWQRLSPKRRMLLKLAAARGLKYVRAVLDEEETAALLAMLPWYKRWFLILAWSAPTI
jgi:hypothetical protein